MLLKKKSNPNIKFINWKKDNKELIITGETQFLFELGNVIINFLVDFKFIKVMVKFLSRDKKKVF